jgi:hypothetical protein
MSMNMNDLKAMAVKLGRSEDELVAEMEKVKQSDFFRSITDEKVKESEAIRVLTSRYAKTILASGVEGEFKVLILKKGTKRRVQTEKAGQKEDRDVMNMVGIGKKYDSKDEFTLFKIAAWGADTDKCKDVEINSSYKVNLKQRTRGTIIEYTVATGTVWNKEKSGINKETVITMLRKICPAISYTEYDKAAGNNLTYLVEGSVIRHFEGQNKKGGTFAMYGIRPSDMEDLQVLLETQGLTIWVDREDVKYGESSLLLFTCQFSQGKDGKGVVANSSLIVPIIEYPLEETGEDLGPQSAPATSSSEPATAPAKTEVKKPSTMFDNVTIVQGKGEDNPFDSLG